MEIHEDLMLYCLDEQQNARTCNYWYTVRSKGLPHTAFNTEAGLRAWLGDRGLSAPESLPSRGSTGSFRIEGRYISNCTMDVESFHGLLRDITSPQIRVLSNGEFTLGILTRNDDGVVCVNYLNPNVKSRMVFNYEQSREEIEPFETASRLKLCNS